ncbi:MAG: hypothetical protein HY924_03665 [Elusimicrobia bacterium]|nr:hypothetical protein [Elusimicrobiota bacterium]
MKTLISVAALCLAFPVLAQDELVPAPALELTAPEAAFLKGCGVQQKDLDIFPSLYEDAQQLLKTAIAKKSCVEQTIVRFKNTRKFVALYHTVPPPQQKPKWDAKKNPWSPDFLTDEESERIVDLESEFISRNLSRK